MNEKTFHVGVKGLLVQDNAVLVLRAVISENASYWDFPGGRVQDNETLEAALVREVQEEVPSLTAVSAGPVVHAARFTKLGNTTPGLALVFYRIHAQFDSIVLSDEHVEYRWITLEDIPTLEQENIGNVDVETFKDPITQLYMKMETTL